jgi:DNA-binding CsgD family transcriptional regulator
MCVHPVAWPEPDPLIAAAIVAKYPGKRPRPLAVQVRDRLGRWLEDEEFAAAFGLRGRPGWFPSRLALVTVLQRVEDLTDRRAAEAVRTRIDWQYLLGLPLDDPGFDHTVLAEFRGKVAEAGLEQVALDALLAKLGAEPAGAGRGGRAGRGGGAGSGAPGLAGAAGSLEAAKRYTADAARLFHLWVALARPWEAVARGERSTAVALALELAEQARSRGQVTFQLQALHDVARLGEPGRVSRWLHEAAAGAEGQLAPLYVAHADALSSHDAVALDRVASGFAGLGLNLLAAEAAAEAAKHHQAAGRRTAAIAATIKADALAAQCEGARTPALDARQSHGLTPRELEIATMAARGLSSKEIAGRLVVSVRTVDNTLRQVYAKLAVNKRAELRPLLAPERDATSAPPM